MTEIDLRSGRWEDVLGDVECDLLLVDAPYSERTHAGHDEGAAAANRVRPEDELRMRVDKRTGAVYPVGVNRRRELNYACWTPADVDRFVEAWSPRVRGWFASITDHVLAPAWESALERVGRYVFSPLACIIRGSRVRMGGDGPAQWAVWLIVARPRTAEFAKWGALPGGYVVAPGLDRGDSERVVGEKPLDLMRALVRDYSREGDTVCDPCAGRGTTLLAAAIEGRRAVGAEMDPAHFAIAQKRIGRGYTPTLFGG